MSTELVTVGPEYYLIEGTPGHYELFRCRLEHVANHRYKHQLRAFALGNIATLEVIDEPDDPRLDV